MYFSQRDWAAFLATLVAVGMLLGVGCSAGCSYIRRHVELDVRWLP